MNYIVIQFCMCTKCWNLDLFDVLISFSVTNQYLTEFFEADAVGVSILFNND